MMKKLLTMLLFVSALCTFTACGDDDEGGSTPNPNPTPTDSTSIEKPTNPITDYSVPTSMTIGEETILTGAGFVEGDTIAFFLDTRSSVVIQPVCIVKASISANGASFTVPDALEAGASYIVCIKRNSIYWELGLTNVVSAKMRIASIAFKDGTGSITFTMTYDTDGRLTQIKSSDYTWDFAYSGNTVTTASHMSRESVTTLTFTLNDEGNVTQSTAANAYLVGKYADNATNTWYYDGEGRLDSIINGSKWYTADLKYTYTGNRTAQMECGGKYSYEYGGEVEVPEGTLPPSILCDLLSCMRYSEDGVLGILLSQAINSPTQVPTKMGMEYQASQSTGEMAVDWMKVTATMADNLLTIKTDKASNNSVGFQGSTAIVTYERR